MLFTPNLICRFFFVTYHYCFFCPPFTFLTHSSSSFLLTKDNSYYSHFISLSIFSLFLNCKTLMATPIARSSSSSIPSLPPPLPKSPPDYPDLYGKRREMARVQMLEREISFLEEELKFVEGLQPASRCCKEMADFVIANSDPLLPSNKKNRRSCRFWKWLWYHFFIWLLHVLVCLVLTSLGSVAAVAAVMGGTAVSLVLNHIAVKIVVVLEIVVYPQVVANSSVHLAPLVAAGNALALALAQHVQRYTHVAVVQSPVGTLVGYVASILYAFPRHKEKR
ncbi:hypothetical protein Lal_00040563 [Lupinus albus]|nr:hypothetical protein Lal_00040563 [Lupinus albus]